ncbi:unnamed protein product, partial [Closterium sp. Yama58-4]
MTVGMAGMRLGMGGTRVGRSYVAKSSPHFGILAASRLPVATPREQPIRHAAASLPPRRIANVAPYAPRHLNYQLLREMGALEVGEDRDFAGLGSRDGVEQWLRT